jgi:hypothetical protein
LVLTTLLTLPVFAAQFQQGDEIKPTRDESLYFRDHVFRQAKAGETFSVLAHSPDTKKVFVRGTDTDGKQIALAIAEDAIAALPMDVAEVQAEAVAAAKSGRFSDGLHRLEHALRANPTDPSLQTAFKGISQLQVAATTLERAKAVKESVLPEIARKRKNATTANRSNPLDRNDRSGQTRAAQMRADADQTEAIHRASVEHAQKEYDSALAQLGAAPGSSGAATDDFVEPILAVEAPNPTYAETIEFINSRLRKGAKMGYGKNLQKMIYRDRHYTYVFDPKDLTPEVKFLTSDNPGSPYYGKNVLFQCRGRRQLIEKRGILQPETAMVRNFAIRASDEVEMTKLGNAVSHLIRILGGTDEAF